MSYTQIVNQPSLYVDNMKVAWASTTTLTVTSGAARDSTNAQDIAVTTASTTLNAAVTGLNGLDTGSLEASKTYYILALYDQTNSAPTGYVISLSSTAPTMPSSNGVTYSQFRVIGIWLTNGSSQFIKGYVTGNGKERHHYHDASIAVLTNGTATTLTAIDLSAAVPALDNTPVRLTVDYTPATAGDKVSIAPGGSTATVLPHVTGSVAAKANSGQLNVVSKLVSSLPTLLYINSAASGDTDAWVDGFDYYL